MTDLQTTAKIAELQARVAIEEVNSLYMKTMNDHCIQNGRTIEYGHGNFIDLLDRLRRYADELGAIAEGLDE